MDGEWLEGIYPGYRTKTIKYGNCTIEINRPILTDEEIAKVDEDIRQALRRFGRSKNNGS